MESLSPVLVLVALAVSCSSDPPPGDVASCTCTTAYIADGDEVGGLPMDVELCLEDFADVTNLATERCLTLAAQLDSRFEHACTCSCVHLDQSCYPEE